MLTKNADEKILTKKCPTKNSRTKNNHGISWNQPKVVPCVHCRWVICLVIFINVPSWFPSGICENIGLFSLVSLGPYSGSKIAVHLYWMKGEVEVSVG